MEENTKKPDASEKDSGSEDKGKEIPTFDDLLKTPEYQAEFDKKVDKAIAKAVENAKAKWLKEAEEAKNEAERLASLTAEEKNKELITKAEKEKNDALSKLNAYKLKEEATKIANEKGLDISLIDLIDYSVENAETVKAKLDTMELMVKKAVEKTVEEKLRQPSPRGVASNGGVDQNKAYLDEKYKDNPFYKK